MVEKQTIRAAVTARMDELGVGITQLARGANLHRSTVSRFLHGQTGVGSDALGRIFDTLTLHLEGGRKGDGSADKD